MKIKERNKRKLLLLGTFQGYWEIMNLSHIFTDEKIKAERVQPKQKNYQINQRPRIQTKFKFLNYIEPVREPLLCVFNRPLRYLFEKQVPGTYLRPTPMQGVGMFGVPQQSAF